MLQSSNFDFDLLARLAKEAPAEFALRRAALIREAVAACDNLAEGNRLQEEIDARRMEGAPGMETSLAIAAMLGSSVERMAARMAALKRQKAAP